MNWLTSKSKNIMWPCWFSHKNSKFNSSSSTTTTDVSQVPGTLLFYILLVYWCNRLHGNKHPSDNGNLHYHYHLHHHCLQGSRHICISSPRYVYFLYFTSLLTFTPPAHLGTSVDDEREKKTAITKHMFYFEMEGQMAQQCQTWCLDIGGRRYVFFFPPCVFSY